MSTTTVLNSYLIVLISLLCLIRIAEPFNKLSRTIAVPNKYPHVVSLQHLVNTTHRAICTGTLIHPGWILTKDSCRLREDYDSGDFLAFGGVSDLGVIKKQYVAIRLVTYWFRFPDYAEKHLLAEGDSSDERVERRNDAALVAVEYDFPTNIYISARYLPPPIQPQPQTNLTKTLPSKSCVLLHWPEHVLALDSTRRLSVTASPVQIIPWHKCNTSNFLDNITHICGQLVTSSRSSFKVETTSGGPLVCDGVQIGVMSSNYRYERRSQDAYGFQDLVNVVFTRCDALYDFIQGVIPGYKHLVMYRNDGDSVISGGFSPYVLIIGFIVLYYVH